MRRPALVLITFLALPGATAGAATIDVTGGALRYTGGSEINSVFISLSGGTYTVSDNNGVVVFAGAGCSNPEGDQTATCTGTVTRLEINGGGGGDFISADNPSLPTYTQVSELSGGDGSDSIHGTKGPDNLNGGAGDDVLQGGGSDDFFFGGDGDGDSASYVDHAGPVTVNLAPGGAADGAGGEGDDANRDGTVESVIGTDAGDTLTGTGTDNLIYGGVGVDTIAGLGGNDDLIGGDGNDVVNGGSGHDEITGDDTFLGLAPGTDTLDGGPDTDTVSYLSHGVGVRVDLSDPGPDSPQNDTLTGFENIKGGYGDDVLIGDAGVNRIDGGWGDDTLDGGLGNDDLGGDNGIDTVTYAARTGNVTFDLTTAFTGGGEGSETDFVNGVENVTGGEGDDRISGTPGRNILEGRGGDDLIDARGGDDVVRGGSGDDLIGGGPGDDLVHGDAGLDQIDAGPGEDAVRLRDGEADRLDCGDAFDTVVADPVDLFQNCESADAGPAAPPPAESGGPGGGAAPAPPAPTPPAAPDTTRPKVTLGRLAASLKRKAFLKGIPLTLSCDEACSWDVELRGSARSVRLARYEVTLAQRAIGRGTGARKVTIKPNKKLVGRAKKLTVQLRITARDAAGNPSTVTRTLKVRP